MRLRFAPNQPHQLEAIRAVVDLFRGQPPRPTDARVLRSDTGGVVQRLDLDDAQLLANVRDVQARGGLAESEALQGRQATVEMETGTGKTYVYLRTMLELHRRYGWSRFVVVVPAVAVREGVLQQVRQTAAHFRDLYGAVGIEARPWRPEAPSEARSFARDGGIQLLVLNVDAFNKRARGGEAGGNRIHRPTDALGGRSPMELLAATRPIVVLDEPQSMEGPQARRAMADLEPLFTLRYSATHRDTPNLVHRLDPVRAHDLGLVKRIEVASVVGEGGAPPAPVEVKGVRATSRGVSARLAIEALGDGGPERRTLTVRGGEDLRSLSGGREVYRDKVVEHVDADRERVVFRDGSAAELGAPLGRELREAVMRRQVEETVREHLERELELQRRSLGGEGASEPSAGETRERDEGPRDGACRPGVRMKVLSLLFVERVADYLGEEADDEGGGRVRRWLEDAWRRLAAEPRYAGLELPPAEAVHAGYFARRSGRAVDTTGRSAADREAQRAIVRDKERLLDPDEPLRFLVSHSALREGWDHPNVFQIATLAPSRSELKKRQELGRGLRLPVREDGRRLTDPELARLVVIANESYEDFARQLQRELRADAGVDLGGRVADRRARRGVRLVARWRDDDALRRLWAVVGRRTRHRVRLDPEGLVERAAEAVGSALPRRGAPQVRVERAALRPGEGGVVAEGVQHRVHETPAAAEPVAVPDPLAHLQRETALTRRTLARILERSGALERLAADPARVLDAAAKAVGRTVRELMARDARYELVDDTPLDPARLAERPPETRGDRSVVLDASVHEALPVRSDAEAAALRRLDGDPAVRLVLPWPRALPVDSPLGPLDPEWAVLRASGSGEDEVLLGPVAGADADPLRAACLRAHARALGARFTERVADPSRPPEAG